MGIASGKKKTRPPKQRRKTFHCGISKSACLRGGSSEKESHYKFTNTSSLFLCQFLLVYLLFIVQYLMTSIYLVVQYSVCMLLLSVQNHTTNNNSDSDNNINTAKRLYV